jgi:O-acetyl-ADP-ribose deacetylase (regulator of RNase III)
MIKTHHGNVLDIPAGIIVHGCNSRGKMSSGIAKEVKHRFPQAFAVYRKDHRRCIADHWLGSQLGSHTSYNVNENKIIVNAITQEYYGRNTNHLYTDYGAILAAFIGIASDEKLYDVAKIHGIHFPLIGCGLGNGNWDAVSDLIDTAISDEISKNLWLFTPP